MCGEFDWQTWGQVSEYIFLEQKIKEGKIILNAFPQVEKQVDVNLVGTLRVTKLCLPLLKVIFQMKPAMLKTRITIRISTPIIIGSAQFENSKCQSNHCTTEARWASPQCLKCCWSVRLSRWAENINYRRNSTLLPNHRWDESL